MGCVVRGPGCTHASTSSLCVFDVGWVHSLVFSPAGGVDGVFMNTLITHINPPYIQLH